MIAKTSIVDAAWVDFAERVKAAGQLITGPDFPADPRLRAEGYRWVARMVNLAHQIYLEFDDSVHPRLFLYNDEITSFGAPNPDNNYYRAAVDPAGTYRVTGDLTGVKEMILSVHDGEMVLGKTAVLAELTLGDLAVGAKGQLELFLGGPPRERNWMPLPDDAVYLNVRQFITDWEHDPIAVLSIERLDGTAAVKNVTPQAIRDALDRAAAYVQASVPFWNQFSAMIVKTAPLNELTPPMRPPAGAVNMMHSVGRWRLDACQALVVEFDEPEATYWSIQAYIPHWLTCVDFVNRVSGLNDAQARVDDDGKVRVVVAHADPGVQNWLDASGLYDGIVNFRLVRPTTAPTPSATVVDIADVRTVLPPSTPTFSREQREAQIAARRGGIARRFRR